MHGFLGGQTGRSMDAWILKWLQGSSSFTDWFTSLYNTIQKCLVMNHLSENSEETSVEGG